MSATNTDRKFMRREVRRSTARLGKQMMENTLKLSFWKRFRIAMIIISKGRIGQ